MSRFRSALLVFFLFCSGAMPALASGGPPDLPPRASGHAVSHAFGALVVDGAGNRYVEAVNGNARRPVGGRAVGVAGACCTTSPAGASPAGDERYGNGRPYALNQSYGGGPVLIDALQPMAILWAPSGTSVPGGYSALIARYLNDEATAYGGDEWNLGYLGEYAFPAYNGATRVPKIAPADGGNVLVDTDPYPPNTCYNPDFPTCVSGTSIEQEALNFGGRNGLNVATMQPVVLLPRDVGYDGFLTQSCGYHGYDPGPNLKWMVIGYDAVRHANGDGTYGTCDTPSHPNGNDADATISVLAHEEAETMTDPQPSTGWDDAQQNQEVGDECAWVFPADQTVYDQAFQVNGKTGQHGDVYFTQMMWSNFFANLYAQYGSSGQGCTNK